MKSLIEIYENNLDAKFGYFYLNPVFENKDIIIIKEYKSSWEAEKDEPTYITILFKEEEIVASYELSSREWLFARIRGDAFWDLEGVWGLRYYNRIKEKFEKYKDLIWIYLM